MSNQVANVPYCPCVVQAKEENPSRYPVRTPQGIVPDHLIEKTIGYYSKKGDMHIVEDFNDNANHFSAMRLRRRNRTSSRDTLPDGQIVNIYTAKNRKKLHKWIVRDGDDAPVHDRSVNEAFNGANQTYLLLKEVYNTNSIDNAHFPLRSTVHYSRNYANAFWDGDEMVYGDGDGKIFNRFTVAIDIPGHEIAHGLTQERCGTEISSDGKATGVDYEGEAGGINEGLSDIFGIQVKQRFKGETAEQSDWLIGNKLLKTINGKTYALRSMTAPGTAFVDHPYLGTDTQVGRYSEYVARDNLEEVDPHDSSGIVNKAFSHAAIKVGGNTWDKIGKVYFDTMPRLAFSETFEGMANKTIKKAQEIFGKGSYEEGAVIEGWKVVEVIK